MKSGAGAPFALAEEGEVSEGEAFVLALSSMSHWGLIAWWLPRLEFGLKIGSNADSHES